MRGWRKAQRSRWLGGEEKSREEEEEEVEEEEKSGARASDSLQRL